MEDGAGSGGGSSESSDWKCLPEDEEAEALATSTDLAYWQKKAKEEESIRKKLDIEVSKAKAREKEAKEETAMWQERAAEEGKQRVKAEVEWAKWQNQAEWQESFRRRAEKEVAELSEKLANAEHWREQWQSKAEAEENLHMLYQQRASRAKEEASLRAKAEAEAAEWKKKATCHQKLEQEAKQYLKEVEEEKALRINLENKVKVDQAIQQLKEQTVQDQRAPDEERNGMQIFKANIANHGVEIAARGAAALMLNSKKNVQLAGQHGAEYRFHISGDNDGLLRGRVFSSPELHFEGLANTSLNYSFMLQSFVNDMDWPPIGVEWILLPGLEPSSLCWPVPAEKVNIVLRTISTHWSGDRVHINEVVLDAAQPSSAHRTGWVVKDLIPWDEWGQNSDVIVQAELLLK